MKASSSSSNAHERRRPRGSTKRKCVPAPPPPPSPKRKTRDGLTPYAVEQVQGNAIALQLARTFTSEPWSEEIVTEMLRNSALPPMAKVNKVLKGRFTLVECSFLMPDGNATENVCIPLNLLSDHYKPHLEHLLSE